MSNRQYRIIILILLIFLSIITFISFGEYKRGLPERKKIPVHLEAQLMSNTAFRGYSIENRIEIEKTELKTDSGTLISMTKEEKGKSRKAVYKEPSKSGDNVSATVYTSIEKKKKNTESEVKINKDTLSYEVTPENREPEKKEEKPQGRTTKASTVLTS